MLKPELLAPAGDWKSFIAAVEAGADGVYFGGKDFSARSFAINLTREEIQKAIDYAHLRGVKCYAAVNILVKDNEFVKLFDHINFLYAEGIDGLIIQDLGVFNFCQKYWPDLPFHASTQMTAHNLNDVLVLKKMGFKRVVLARELTIEEMRDIKNKLQSTSTANSPKRRELEIECFVHGALCFSYSGQCLLSSMIGGRSGNRGKCAQPCRKKYALVERGTKSSYFPLCQKGIKGDLNLGSYLLSAKDLCALDILEKIQFVNSLKIEGRMKGAAYVGGAVEKYRKAIESAARNEKLSPEEIEADKKEMAALFNRGGFSRGYLLDKKPKDLISSERSKNFGVPAGEVIEARRGAVKIRTKGVGINDGLEIWGRFGQEKNIGFRVEKISGDIVNIFIDGDVRAGDKVYKNYDYKLNKKLELLAKENYRKKIPVKMVFRAKEGENISLEMNGVKIKGAKAESAINIRTGEDAAREQLAKLGSAPFFAEKIDIEIIGKVYIPLKNLNNLRRTCALKLEKEIINSFKRQKKNSDFNNTLILPCIKAGNKEKEKREVLGKNICVQSNSYDVLEKLLNKKISRVYTSLPIDAEKFREKGIEVFQSLPRIFRKGEKIEIFANYDGFLAPALGYLRILPLQTKKIGDFSLNIFNNYSARELKNLGFAGFTASLENTLEEINGIETSGMEKEAVVYGHLPLMISEHCALRGTKHCRAKNLGVKDEKKVIFPILTDCANCRMRILNSAPLCFSDIEKLKSDNIRIIHTIESPEKIIKIVENYLSGSFGPVENTTTGHFYRGVE